MDEALKRVIKRKVIRVKPPSYPGAPPLTEESLDSLGDGLPEDQSFAQLQIDCAGRAVIFELLQSRSEIKPRLINPGRQASQQRLITADMTLSDLFQAIDRYAEMAGLRSELERNMDSTYGPRAEWGPVTPIDLTGTYDPERTIDTMVENVDRWFKDVYVSYRPEEGTPFYDYENAILNAHGYDLEFPCVVPATPRDETDDALDD